MRRRSTWVGVMLAAGVPWVAGRAAAQPAPVRVALRDTAAPAGGNYNTFGEPVLNGSGQVAFVASLTGGSSSVGGFAGAPGALQAFALQGQPAPAGGTYSTLDRVVLNGSGQVAFLAGLTGGTSGAGVFAGAPGAVQTVALQGQPAPAGGNYDGFSLPVLNGTGQAAFQATLTGGSSTAGIFAGSPGAVQAAALQGQASPAGGNYIVVLPPALSGSGQVAFLAGVTGGSSGLVGVFAGAPGAVQVVALQGQAAPGGGSYGSFSSDQLTVNGSGQVAFRANLVGGSGTQGVFVGTPGAVQAVARRGQAAPAGGFYDNLATDQRLSLNASGQVAFRAGLTGGSSDVGVFVGSPGAVQAAVLVGQPAPAGGTFSGFFVPALNGSGQVAFLGA